MYAAFLWVIMTYDLLQHIFKIVAAYNPVLICRRFYDINTQVKFIFRGVLSRKINYSIRKTEHDLW
jgi:hypothetical protein